MFSKARVSKRRSYQGGVHNGNVHGYANLSGFLGRSLARYEGRSVCELSRSMNGSCYLAGCLGRRVVGAHYAGKLFRACQRREVKNQRYSCSSGAAYVCPGKSGEIKHLTSGGAGPR